jgi:hypothetical protein
MSRHAERDDAARWWLEPGTEQCGACFAWYHYELTVHCQACDAPFCPTCVVEVRLADLDVVCRACAEDLP